VSANINEESEMFKLFARGCRCRFLFCFLGVVMQFIKNTADTVQKPRSRGKIIKTT